jgi:hypothetical protein
MASTQFGQQRQQSRAGRVAETFAIAATLSVAVVSFASVLFISTMIVVGTTWADVLRYGAIPFAWGLVLSAGVKFAGWLAEA